MTRFESTYKEFISNACQKESPFGFDLGKLALVEPVLKYLYQNWWQVKISGLEHLPSKGAAVIVGNSAGLIPWPALMLLYALMSDKNAPRRLNIVADLDWIKDELIRSSLLKLGFVPWSSANLKQLFAQGELVAIFPEGLSAIGKPFSERYRLREFDWTRLLPAVEAGITIYPMATLGCDEAQPTITNLDWLARFLAIPAYPISPFFPWLPFPFNLASFPVQWKMAVINSTVYEPHSNRDNLEDTAKSQSRLIEGEIQAELNRLLRTRFKNHA